MKRFILAATVALVGLVSCEKELADAIVGTWEATSVEMTVEGVKMEIDIEEAGLELSFTFKSNGTASVTEKTDGESFTESFDYYVEDGMLYLTLFGDTMAMQVPGDGTLNMEAFYELATPGIRALVMTHASNMCGTVMPVKA